MQKLFIILLAIAMFSCKDYKDEAVVKYVISGTGTCSIQYTIGDDYFSTGTVTLPWEYTYKLWTTDSEREFTAYLSATYLTGSSITMEIYVDGGLQNSVTFSNGSQNIQVAIVLEYEDDWD
jgi:hypothetical protein